MHTQRVVQRVVRRQSAYCLRECKIASSQTLANSQCRAASSVPWRYGSRCAAHSNQSWIPYCAQSTAGLELRPRVQSASHRPSRGLNVLVNSLSSSSTPSRRFSNGVPLSYPISSNSATPPQRVDVVSTFLCLDPPSRSPSDTPTQSSSQTSPNPPSSSHSHSDWEALSTFRIALLRRRPDRSVYASKWAVVSGKVESKHSELPLDAAVREVYEETGLVVDTGTDTNIDRNSTIYTKNAEPRTDKQYTARLLLIGTPYDKADEQINKIWRIHPFLVQILWRDTLMQAPSGTPSEASGSSEGKATGGPQAETKTETATDPVVKAATSLIHLDTTENEEIRFVALDDMHRFDTVDGLEGTARALVGEYLRMKTETKTKT